MARPERLSLVRHAGDAAAGERSPHRVVIVGGGFAGLFAARALGGSGITVPE